MARSLNTAWMMAGNLGVKPDRQGILADHVDVALVKLAKAPALRALTAIDALDLVAPERKIEFMLMFRHIAGERHGEVEAQGQFGLAALLHGTGGLHEVHLTLGFTARLGQQDIGEFHHRGFHRQETKALVVATDRIEHALERDLVQRQQFQYARHGAGGGQGHGSPRENGVRSAIARPGAGRLGYQNTRFVSIRRCTSPAPRLSFAARSQRAGIGV
jgi:hypothetical protein